MKKYLPHFGLFVFFVGAAALAGDFTYSVPTAGVTPGPTWASQISTALTYLKTHTHDGTATEGPQLGSNALSINADLSFNNSYAATGMQHTTYYSQASSASVDNKSVYVLNNDLYYKNNSGTAVRLTNGSSTAQTTEGIFGNYRNTGGTAYFDTSNDLFSFMSSATTPTYSEANIADNTIALAKGIMEDLILQGDAGAPEIFFESGGSADLGAVHIMFDDDDELGAPVFTAEDGEAGAALSVTSRRAQPAGSGTTYYGDTYTVDEDYGHVIVGQYTMTSISDSELAGRVSSNGKCDPSTANCAHYPIFQVQGGAYPAEMWVQSDDQAALYLYDAKDSGGSSTLRLWALKAASGTTDATNILDIGAYSSNVRTGGIQLTGGGDMTVTNDITAGGDVSAPNLIATTATQTKSLDISADGQSIWLGSWGNCTATNVYGIGLGIGVATPNSTAMYCRIPMPSDADVAVTTVAPYWVEDGSNCKVTANGVFYSSSISTTAPSAVSGAPAVPQTLSGGTSPTVGSSFTTDFGGAASGAQIAWAYWVLDASDAACLSTYLAGYSVAYCHESGGACAAGDGYFNFFDFNQ